MTQWYSGYTASLVIFLLLITRIFSFFESTTIIFSEFPVNICVASFVVCAFMGQRFFNQVYNIPMIVMVLVSGQTNKRANKQKQPSSQRTNTNRQTDKQTKKAIILNNTMPFSVAKSTRPSQSKRKRRTCKFQKPIERSRIRSQ